MTIGVRDPSPRQARDLSAHDAGEVVVRQLEPADAALFGSYVSRHADATFYHTLSWRDFVVDMFRHRPVYFVAMRQGSVTGVLPAFLVRAPGLGAKLISLPYDIGSGGALADDEASERALSEAALRLGRSEAVRYVEMRRAADSPVLEALGLAAVRPVLLSELAIGSREAVWSRIKKDHKQAVQMARQRGVVIREAGSAADFETFYRIYLSVFRDFGTPPYSRRYFSALYDRFHGPQNVRLLLADADGRTVGGLLVFCFGRIWTNKFTVCLPQAFQLRANPALYGAAINLAIDHGAARFSMGSSAPHQTGLLDFKQRWGATTRHAVLYTAAVRGSAPDLSRYFNEQGLAQRIWRRLPVFATRPLGGTLNRWFC
jgi:hypothetical protein